MFRYFCLVPTLIALCLLQSCKTLKKTETEEHAKNEHTIKPKIEPANGSYHPSKTRYWDLLHTRLDVSFDWTKQYLNGNAVLRLKPYFYTQNSIDIDAKGMDLHKIELVKPKVLSLKYNYDKKVIKITLDKDYTFSDTIELNIVYTSKPNELPKGGSAAITEDKGLYFINPDGSDKSKPKQIWTQGETEASSCWFPTIDATNERCTQEMYITVDTVYTVLSNGEMIYSKSNSNGTKTEYWKMDLPHAPYLFMMAIGEYAVVEDVMPGNSKYDWKDLELKYYVEPKYKPYAKNIFGNTPEMINFFSQLLNYQYPWSKFSQIVVRDYVSGAMENTTAVVFMENLQVDDRELLDEHWDGIIAHELFHHWFGDLATCESWANLPLNESFANYSEYLWTEHKYGLEEAIVLSQKEKSEYLDEAKRKQEPLIRYHYKDKEDMFDRHSYNKGGRVLHMLRKYVGDEAFFKSLNLYLTKHKFSSTEVHDLRLAFEEVTGEDLNWFFNQWFLAPGHADLTIQHSYSDGNINILVNQTQDTSFTPVYKLYLPVEWVIDGVVKRQNIFINQTTQIVKIPSATAPQTIMVDPDQELLGTIHHVKTKQELVLQYKYGERFASRLEALKGLFEHDKKESKENPKLNDPEIKQLLGTALKDPFWTVRDYALDQFFSYSIQGIEQFVPSIEQIALSDSKPSVRAKAIYFLSAYNSNNYTGIFEKGLQEKPYSVVGASLTGYLRTGAPDGEQKLKEFEGTDNINIVLPLANYYLQTKNPNKYSWFKEKMNTGNAQKLYNMLMFFGQYLSIVTPSEREDGKKILQKIAKENKYDVIKELAKGFL